jgi:starch synthase
VPVGVRTARHRDELALADAVNALVRDPARAAEFGARGRERAVSEFSWDRIAAQTAELYAELARRQLG